MPWFRSKPKVIEAWQYSGEQNCRGVCLCTRMDRPHVHTAHDGAPVAVVFGDFISPELNQPGRHYPIKPDVMRERYEECGPDGPGDFSGPEVDLQATQGFPAHD